MTYNVQTYEFTAFAESDFGVGNVGCGDTFTMPGDATVCFSVTDNDSTLSGDSCYNENSNDGSYQTASIIDAATGQELGNGGQTQQVRRRDVDGRHRVGLGLWGGWW